MLKIIINSFALVPLALLLLGAVPNLHPIADSVAVFRVPIGGITVLVGAIFLSFWPRKLAWMTIALGAGAALPILYASFPDSPDPTARYSLYQKNLSFRNRDIGRVLLDIQTRKPDFVTLQEVTKPHLSLLKSLETEYPAQLICAFSTVGSVAVAARWPMIADSQTCIEGQGLAAIKLVTPDGLRWLVSLHFHWPYPYGQAVQVKKLLPVISAFDAPLIVAGDFNMVPWSGVVTRLEYAGNLERVGHINRTFWLKGIYPMPIDHVLIPSPNKGSVETLPLLGSDHNGVLARFSLDKLPKPTPQ